MAAEYASLRAELKQWERSFQAEHGRKATPDDIRLVQGLADKYKRFKILSKSPAQQQQQTTSKALVPSKPIIAHSIPIESDRDPLPPSARPNPFSPVKRATGSQQAKPKPSNEFPSFPNLFASPTKRSYATRKFSPPGSPNPFLSPPSFRAQPDSPFTAARKRIRGEGEGEETSDSALMRPDKKRRSTMNRSVSASTSTAASGLFALGPSAYGGSGNLFGSGKSLNLTGEVLEESPVKQSTLNGAVYRPIFDDDDISLRSNGTSGRGTTRTVSAPVVPFFGRKADAQQSISTSRRTTDSEPGRSVQSLHLEDEDEQMEEDEPTPGMTLLAPTPVKEGENNRWKSKTTAKSKKSKNYKSKLKVEEEDYEEESEGDDSHHSELSVMEIGWRIMGPLYTGALVKDNDEEMQGADDDDDDENFRLIPPIQLRSMSRRVEYDQGEEPERVDIDLPDEMKDILQLSPKKSKVGDEVIVQDLLSGKGDRTKRAEVWLPGDGGDESDDWESEGAGWWEAEL